MENEKEQAEKKADGNIPKRKKTDGSNPPWVAILVAIIGLAGVIGVAIINKGCGDNPGNTNNSPKTLSLAITKPSPDGKIEATQKSNDNAAYFPVGVSVAGDAPSSDLGIYIIVFEDGDWYIQNHKEIKAGYQEVVAWSGGGKDNNAKAGTQVKVRAVAANINSTGEYMKTHKTVSEDAKELNPVALSYSVSATISSIK